jgi:hypothetical protein
VARITTRSLLKGGMGLHAGAGVAEPSTDLPSLLNVRVSLEHPALPDPADTSGRRSAPTQVISDAAPGNLGHG